MTVKYGVVLLRRECRINGKIDIHELHIFTGAGSIFDVWDHLTIVVTTVLFDCYIFHFFPFPLGLNYPSQIHEALKQQVPKTA